MVQLFFLMGYVTNEFQLVIPRPVLSTPRGTYIHKYVLAVLIIT